MESITLGSGLFPTRSRTGQPARCAGRGWGSAQSARASREGAHHCEDTLFSSLAVLSFLKKQEPWLTWVWEAARGKAHRSTPRL